jgi:hypothetical protein
MTMDIWQYRATGTVTDLKEFEVEATDGSIGTVDEATEDVSRSWIVVDTGPWIFGRKVVLPAGTIERVDLEDRRIVVDLSKDQIKDSPEYDPEQHRGDEAYYESLGTYYGDVSTTR